MQTETSPPAVLKSTGKEASVKPVSRASMILFSMITILYWASLYTYVPILSPYLESLGFSFSLVGIILGSYGFMQIVVRLPLGIWSDRLRKRKPFIALGFITATLSSLLFAVSGQWGWTLAARAMAGVSASTWVAFTVLYAGYYRREEATRAMGVISFLTVAGQLVGMAVSGLLADGWGWRGTFLAGAVFGAVGLAASLWIKETPGDPNRPPIRSKDLTSVIKSPTLWKVSTLSILAHSILFITMFGFTPSQALALGASKPDLTLLSVAFMIPHAITAIVSGRWFAPRFGPWNTAVAGFTLSAIFTLSIPFVPSFGMLALTQAANGFAQGLHMPLLLGLAIQEIEPDKRATAMGFYQAVYAVGMFNGPFIAGWLNEHFGLTGGFTLGAAIGIAAAVLAFIWSRKRKKHAA